jgi:hypothetical protein
MPKRPDPGSDDACLFPSPVELASWAGCIRVWNATLDLNRHWVSRLEEVLQRSKAGALLRGDWIVWEKEIETVVQRFVRSSEIRDEAFKSALRLRFGIEVGTTVVELPNPARNNGPMLVRVKRGELPVRGIDRTLGLFFDVIEELDGQFLACPTDFFFWEGSPKSFSSKSRILPEVRAIDPDAPGLPGLPAEVFDDALMDGLHRRIGSTLDRRAALLSFWDHKRQMRRADAAHFKGGDVVQIRPKSGNPFHVVVHSVDPSGAIHCYDPRKVRSNNAWQIESLVRISAPASRCKVQLPRASYNPRRAQIPASALYLLALRESARLRYGTEEAAPR